ncbi:MAG: glucosaminidase domain-containing protein [Kurthia sp.]|nr:glucosaminidase domain-containing protein [Candidatus Kurthia equi]
METKTKIVVWMLWAGLMLVAIDLNIVHNRISKLENGEQMEVKKDSTVDLSHLELNKENFEFVCHYYEIHHPEIVYAQAQLESGHFTSSVYKNKNNFLGLYDSRKHEYYTFNHWTECLRGYRDYVQVKWDGNGDYYQFLTDLPYATDSLYIGKIKSLAKKFNT